MTAPERRPWSRDELLLAMNLYCRLPFGQQHMGNREVVTLARALGRTPSSIAMKLSNLTSLDPDERSRGVRGLSRVSRLDKAVWDEFHADWDGLSAESELLWSRNVDGQALTANDALPETVSPGPETEVQRLVRARLTQRFFRHAVLASYNGRCCITGLPVPELLEAAHIVSWSANTEHRNNPRNGICLSRLHHAAFDCGLIAFDSGRRLLVSSHLRKFEGSEPVRSAFLDFEGREMNMPEKFEPSVSLFDEHRLNVFQG